MLYCIIHDIIGTYNLYNCSRRSRYFVTPPPLTKREYLLFNNRTYYNIILLLSSFDKPFVSFFHLLCIAYLFFCRRFRTQNHRRRGRPVGFARTEHERFPRRYYYCAYNTRKYAQTRHFRVSTIALQQFASVYILL